MIAGYIAVFLLMFFTATGCGSGDKGAVQQPAGDDSVTGADGAGGSAATPPAASGSAASTELTSEEKAKAEEKLSTATKAVLGTPFKIMSLGETYVFGLGITNVFPKEKKFKMAVRLREAKTSGGVATLIPGIDETIEDWLSKNKFKTITIGSGEETVVPIIVTVGPKISATQATIAGSYAFDVNVEYEQSDQFFDDYVELDLTVKVKG